MHLKLEDMIKEEKNTKQSKIKNNWVTINRNNKA